MATLFDEASLALIPSGHKDGKLYSIKPTDASGDLDFSRGSDIEASYRNTDGTLVFSKVNLLDNPNRFDTTWTTTNAGVIGGQADKDGGTDAWELSKSAANGLIQQSITTSGVIVLSAFVKANTLDWVTIQGQTPSGSFAYFDLSNGVVGTEGSNVIDAQISDEGDGWYRCSLAVEGAITNFRIFPADGDSDVSGTSGSIYIQDAQLNYGLVADDYVEQGVPMTYASTSNLLTAPNDFSDAAWTSSNTTETGGQADKDGGTDAWLLENPTGVNGYLKQDFSFSAKSAKFSVYAKAGTTDFFTLYFVGGGDLAGHFDLGTGVSSGPTTIEDVGSGWYRCTLYNTAGVDRTSARFYVTDTYNTFSYTAGDNIYIQDASLDWRSGERVDTANNELTAPNDFDDAAWTNFNSTETSGQIDKDGGTTAWLLDKTGASGTIRQPSLSVSGKQTFSLFAKEGTEQGVLLSTNLSSTEAKFNLNTGALISAQSGVIDTAIQPAGNGYYLVSIVVEGTLTQANIFVTDSSGSTAGTSGNIYIQDARLAEGNEILGYVQGLTADLPRINLPVGASCPSLLLEPSRTNEFTDSFYFEGIGLSSSTEIVNSIESPQGVVNASKIYPTATGTFRGGVSKNFGATLSNTPHTLSVFAKAGEFNDMYFYNLGAAGGNNGVWFDLSDGSVGTTGAAWTNVDTIDYGNGWYRCVATFTPQGSSDYAYILSADSDASTTITANGTDGLYLWGAQLEEGSYATSLIPTYGASATRAAEILDRGANLSYTGDYTLFMEFELTEDNLYLLGANTSTNYSLYIDDDDCYFQFGRTGGDSGTVFFVNMFDWDAALGTTIKMAFYKSGTSAKLFVNGTAYDPSTNTLSTGNEVLDWRYLDYTATANRQEQAFIKALLEFETALTDSECIALTTL